MIIDKSVIMTIINLEEDAAKFAEALQNSDKIYISAVNFFELQVYMENKYGDKGIREMNNFFKKANIKIHEVNEKMVDIACDANRFYGKGKGRESGLAYGECFAYALAKYLNEPLLFKGEHFKNTDIVTA